MAVRIKGIWQEGPKGRDICRSYTAVGTKGEAITLRRAYSPSHRMKRWYLTVTPVDGKPKAVEIVEIGPHESFDHVEGVLLAWGTT